MPKTGHFYFFILFIAIAYNNTYNKSKDKRDLNDFKIDNIIFTSV